MPPEAWIPGSRHPSWLLPTWYLKVPISGTPEIGGAPRNDELRRRARLAAAGWRHRHAVGGIFVELVAQRADRDAEHIGRVRVLRPPWNSERLFHFYFYLGRDFQGSCDGRIYIHINAACVERHHE
jgi:hypothetical protein